MQSVSPRDHPCPDGGIGRRAGLKIQCPLKTCGFEPRSGHEKGSPRGSLSRALFGRMSRPGHPSRYPLPKSLPSGEGLGGRSRRSPAGSVASLRKGFDSRSIQHHIGPSTPSADDYPFYDRTRACIGPIGGPEQAFFALFARIGPINGPIRAPLGETREESDSQHVASDKNDLFCSPRDAAARRRERFQGFL